MKYTVVIEDAGNNYLAYVPDLPGCIANSQSIEEIEVTNNDTNKKKCEKVISRALSKWHFGADDEHSSSLKHYRIFSLNG